MAHATFRPAFSEGVNVNIPLPVSDDTILQLKNAAVYYWKSNGLFRREKFWALEKITLDLKQGESLGIIGRNGAGKSTLLRIMAGIMAPDRGIFIKNYQKVSLLSIQAGFNPHLSGRDNAFMSGMLLGIRRKDLDKKMDEIIAFAELEDFIDEPIRSYSTGMRARLGFSVAIQLQPELLLIDEVISVGDAAFRLKSAQAMRDRISSDQTVVLVSHSLEIVKRLCTRVVWIENGETFQEGNTDVVLKEYKDYMEKMTKRKSAVRKRLAS